MECIKLLQSSGADFHKKDKCGRYVNRELCFKCLSKRGGEQSIWKSCYSEMVNREASWGDSILRRKSLFVAKHQQSRQQAPRQASPFTASVRRANCVLSSSFFPIATLYPSPPHAPWLLALQQISSLTNLPRQTPTHPPKYMSSNTSRPL